MFELNENISEEAGNLRVACIGKTAGIWKRQSFAEEFMLLEGNPSDSSSWKGVDIGFLLADAEKEEDVIKFKKAIEAANIYDIACIPGLVNLDLYDVQTVCKDKKKILLATGEAKGENASMIAAEKAMSKLTEQDENAQRSGKDVLLNVTGSEDKLSMFEIQEVSEALCDWLKNKEAAIIWGASADNSLDDVIRVSILMGV